MPQENNLDSDLTVLENLLTYARYYDMDSTTALARAWESLFLFQLGERAHHRIDTLSGGMQRRLLIARALIHQPSVLLLDEPTTGLDPQAARHLVWQKLTTLKEQGITMILCTHYMEEAARLRDRLVIMNHGKILAQGTPRDLVRQYVGGKVVEVPSGGELADRVTELARQNGMEVEEYGDTLYMFSPNGEASAAALELEDEQAIVRAANLEDVFLRLAGRELREE